MYLGYLIAVLFILVYYGIQKYTGPKLRPAAEVYADVKVRTSKKKNSRKISAAPVKTLLKNDNIPLKAFVIAGIAAFALRLIMGYFLKGYPSDMSCWISWGNSVLNNGPGHFYAPDYFCDYPPGYITVLGFFAWIADIFNITGEKALHLCFKMPGILADMGLMISVFVIGSRHMNKRSALLLGILLMVNPLLLINSAAWGQIESVLAVFLILSMYNIYKKNYYIGGILYVLAVLIKPQALMIGPVILFAYLASKDWKMILKMIGIGIVLLFIFIIPYNYDAWTAADSSFFEKLLNAFNLVWLIEKYKNTLASYPYFTINAFNLYALFELNWATLEAGGTAQTVLNILNYGLILLAVAGSLVLFIKIKSPSGKIFIPSFFIIAFLFTFGLKMHERYLITPILFLIFEYIISKNKRTLGIFAVLSSVNFINVFCILRYILMYNTSGPPYEAIALASLIEVITFIISMFVIIHDYILYPSVTSGEERKYNTPLDNWIQKGKTAYFALCAKLSSGAGRLIGGGDKLQASKTEKIVRADLIAMAVIIVAYSIVAYVNLGNTKSPQTFYQPSRANEEIRIDLGSVQSIDTVSYYLGIGDVGSNPEMTLAYSTDGMSWTDLNAPCELKSVFKWEVNELNAPVQARYIRGVSSAVDYRMFEIAFWDPQGGLIEIQSVSGSDDCANIADEQDMAQYRTSFMNGTYFDEIYHPRTAYEHLHLMPYYETTHPPLGKLIMSVGIAVFGMTPFGWRVMGTLFGILMLPLMYVMLKKLFERTRYAVLGTLILAFDFMHFSLTRLGTIDSYSVAFIMAMYLFMFIFGKNALRIAKNEAYKLKDFAIVKKLFVPLLLSGLMFGLGAATKWICLYAGAGLAVEFFMILAGIYMALPKKHKKVFSAFAVKTCLSCVVFFIAIPGVIYLLSYLPISMVEGYPNVWTTMLNNQKYMYNYHSNLEATHPYSSTWYQWPVVYRPLWAYSAPVETVGQNNIGCISIMGNPLVFWACIAAFFYTVIVGIIKRDKKVLFLTVAFLAQYLPWMLVTRCVFIYHFFASLPFLIMMIVYTLRDLEERFGWFRHISNCYVALCGLLFVGFYPVLSGMTITKEYSNIWLKWLSTWVFHNRGN